MIGDLGLVKSMESIASFAGTPYYMSPESLEETDIGYFTNVNPLKGRRFGPADNGIQE